LKKLNIDNYFLISRKYSVTLISLYSSSACVGYEMILK